MSRFHLEPYEDVLGGVRYRDDTLRLGPSIGGLALTGLALAFGALFVAVGIAARSPFFLLAAVLQTLLCLPYLWCRVVATGRSIVVVNKWRRYSLTIDDIAAAQIEGFEPGLGFLPFAAFTTLWPRSFEACYLVRRNGPPVRCDALVGMPGEERPLAPTPVEVKQAILQRWIAAARAGTVSPA